jgi:hypothetical protein
MVKRVLLRVKNFNQFITLICQPAHTPPLSHRIVKAKRHVRFHVELACLPLL